MEIRLSSICDESAVNELANFSVQKGKNYKYNKKPVLNWLAAGFFLIMIITSLLLDMENKLLLVGMCMIGLIFSMVLIFIVPRIVCGNAKKLIGLKSIYTFDDDFLTVESENALMQENCKMLYDFIEKVYETSMYIYVFINSEQTFVISKGINKPEDILNARSLLVSKLPEKKYILCKG